MPARAVAGVLQLFWWWIALCGLMGGVLLWAVAGTAPAPPASLAVPAPTAAATVLVVPLTLPQGMPTPTGVPCPPLPPLPPDAAMPPSDGWVWRGTGAPGSSGGAWWNITTDEYLFYHQKPSKHGLHWDYRDPQGVVWRIYPDGRCEKKGR